MLEVKILYNYLSLNVKEEIYCSAQPKQQVANEDIYYFNINI